MHVSTLSMGISLERMSVLGPRGLRPLGPKTDILSRDIPHAQSGDIYSLMYVSVSLFQHYLLSSFPPRDH